MTEERAQFDWLAAAGRYRRVRDAHDNQAGMTPSAPQLRSPVAPPKGSEDLRDDVSGGRPPRDAVTLSCVMRWARLATGPLVGCQHEPMIDQFDKRVSTGLSST